MTNEYFNAMKADLLATHKDLICEDGVVEIEQATDLEQFINVLHKYIAVASFSNFPSIDWVRKWFNDYRGDANLYGCYLDQIRSLNDVPQKNIILFGDCRITFICTKPKNYTILARDNSQISTILNGVCGVLLFLKGNAQHHSIRKEQYSSLRIKSYEN